MTKIDLEHLSDDIRRQLEQQAALHGCSVESELESILKDVFGHHEEESSLKELLLAVGWVTLTLTQRNF